MKAFRIGRKPVGVWSNMVPPIRGGVYRSLVSPSHGADQEPLADIDVDSSSSDLDDADSVSRGDRSVSPASDIDGGSLASSITSVSADGDDLEDEDHLPTAGLRKRAVPSSEKDKASKSDPIRRLSPAEYTEWAIRQDEERDAKDYPPIEIAVQQEIARKYRELHQKVRDGGYYECPYLDYAKEGARYTTLFVSFLLFLKYEWYTLSAICLGIFWVCS
jgi:sphingolipid 8-(E)-desaturase